MIYQAFEFDSSVIDYDTYKDQKIAQGWEDIDPEEIKEHAWPLTRSARLTVHRDKNISVFVLKRPERKPQS